jgi:hypothetical protein
MGQLVVNDFPAAESAGLDGIGTGECWVSCDYGYNNLEFYG